MTAEVELIAVEGRKLRFRVALRDERKPIGEGSHERAIIRTESVLCRVEAKRATLDLGDVLPTPRSACG